MLIDLFSREDMLFRSAISRRHPSHFSCILCLRDRGCDYESLHDFSKRVRVVCCVSGPYSLATITCLGCLLDSRCLSTDLAPQNVPKIGIMGALSVRNSR